MLNGRLGGKVAIVTGASRGMGYSIAERLVHEGARVAMVARGANDLEQAASRIGSSALPLACDIGDPDAVRKTFAAVAAQWGGLDILINNAALATPNPIEEANDGDVRTEIMVNIAGPLYCCREAIPLMRARGGGDIVNISSESVRHPYPHLTLYAATKAALEVFSTGLQGEVANDGIRVTVYRSGNVRGTFSQNWSDKARTRARAAARARGFYHESGAQIEPEIPAEMIANLLALPFEAQVDLIELRGIRPSASTIAARSAADPSTF